GRRDFSRLPFFNARSSPRLQAWQGRTFRSFPTASRRIWAAAYCWSWPAHLERLHQDINGKCYATEDQGYFFSYRRTSSDCRLFFSTKRRGNRSKLRCSVLWCSRSCFDVDLPRGAAQEE